MPVFLPVFLFVHNMLKGDLDVIKLSAVLAAPVVGHAFPIFYRMKGGKGIAREKLYPLGIPTSSRFSKQETCAQAKQRLGLYEDKKYILVAGGSMGGGTIERTNECLQAYFKERRDIGLIVICGSNQTLYQKLSAQAKSNLIVLGHTNQMAVYMRAS